MNFTQRQKQIVEIVKSKEPVSGDVIAEELGLAKSTLRSDLAVLTMTGVLDARPKVGYIYSGLEPQSLLFEQFNQYKVADVMIQPVIVYPDTMVNDAITSLFMYDVGSLYVADSTSKSLIGVVSRKDLLRSLIAGQAEKTAVAIVMTRMPNIIAVTPEMTVLKAAELISNHQIDSLPVISSDDQVIGKMSKTNIIDLLVELSSEEDA
ncbi:MAG: helix-turn-helix transcriptional regulator [Ruoffia tabacinasalis]|jgi:CBS domain-containing protein/biotin operon repressor|uniref:Helix-turn-helix transcriptional regulator n=1 Tax=Ruoffia tabacinasalis TaxID=87458 RepID=A0A5R9EFN3_9LACT|nr:helix-turn-helix transcriptional regulator [Ruoffia tabacinasalis]MBG9979042.1 helix-turn-helix transcriptional regulator [Ruoffia tabacinasalis]TLQ49257.1 helix-turn-helix transcriptional regulator [Ruoffia tabacinasalis]